LKRRYRGEQFNDLYLNLLIGPKNFQKVKNFNKKEEKHLLHEEYLCEEEKRETTNW